MSTPPVPVTQYEWIEQPGLGVRLKFRKDTTGFYEREGAPGTRPVRDNFLYRVEGDRLALKFAHAREWTDVGVTFRAGPASAEARVGRWLLILEHDPYARLFEERESGPVNLVSDSGAALAG